MLTNDVSGFEMDTSFPLATYGERTASGLWSGQESMVYKSGSVEVSATERITSCCISKSSHRHRRINRHSRIDSLPLIGLTTPNQTWQTGKHCTFLFRTGNSPCNLQRLVLHVEAG